MKKTAFAILLSLSLTASLAAGGQAFAAVQTNITYSSPPLAKYKVSAGDTLYFIGKRYGLTVNKLLQLNPNINPNNLYKGQIIKLKSSTSLTTSAPKPAALAKSSFEQQVVALVNKKRANAGLKPLKVSTKLATMAKAKAIDMFSSDYFDHNSPKYGSPFDMMKSYGISYGYAGENIAKGQQTPQEVMTAWMNSQGHRENILNAHYKTIGVAYYKGEWVQEFIG